MSAASDGHTILKASLTTSTKPDGSQTKVEVIRTRSADGVITERSVTRRIPALGGPTLGSDNTSNEASNEACNEASDSVSKVASAPPSRTAVGHFFPRSSYHHERLASDLDSSQEASGNDSFPAIPNAVTVPNSLPDPASTQINIPAHEPPMMVTAEPTTAPDADRNIIFEGALVQPVVRPPIQEGAHRPFHSGHYPPAQPVGHLHLQQVPGQCFQSPNQPRMTMQDQTGMRQVSGQFPFEDAHVFTQQVAQTPFHQSLQQPATQDQDRMSAIQQASGQHPIEQQARPQSRSPSETFPINNSHFSGNLSNISWACNKKKGVCALMIVILGSVCVALGVVLSQSNGKSNANNTVTREESPISPSAPPTSSPSSSLKTQLITPNSNCASFVINLVTDRYANETYWGLRSQQFLLMEGGPYPFGQTTIVDTICLPIGSYEFFIYDLGNDGICCQYGMGGYGIRIGRAELRPFSTGTFGTEERITFEVTAKDMLYSAKMDTNAPSSTPSVSTITPSAIPSLAPSSFPTLLPSENWKSVMPTSCSNIKIEIVTDSLTGGEDGDKVLWELIQRDSSKTVLHGGPLIDNGFHVYDICLPNGRYLFHISDSSGDGFDTEDESGFFVYKDNLLIGSSNEFYHDAYFDFSLPCNGNECNDQGLDFCSSDFYLSISLNGSPEDIYWEVADDVTGEVILKGGPYDKQFIVLTHQACLPNGQYTFTIHVGVDGLLFPHFFSLVINNKLVVDVEDGRDFGSTDVVSFMVESPPPTSMPSSSLVPTNMASSQCYDVRIYFFTDINTGPDIKGGVMTWQLIREGMVVASGGPLAGNQTQSIGYCLPAGVYTFNLTDSGGDGFGDNCLTDDVICGYYIASGDVSVGGGVMFGDNLLFTFQIPYYGDEPDGDDYEFCFDDFFLAIYTDEKPEETTWKLFDERGDVVLSGGPYPKQNGIYTNWACLPDGKFDFTIYDSGGDGIAYPGWYKLAIEGTFFVERGGLFGASNTTTFTLGISASMTDQPTISPTPTNLPDCTEFGIIIQADSDAGGTDGDEITWELLHKETGNVVASDGPLKKNDSYLAYECLEEGTYVFNITDSGGNGFGSCDVCGYSIYSEGVLVGRSIYFFDNELFTFQVPFYGDEPDNDGYNICSEDFWAAVWTDDWPNETRWELVNSNGEIQLSGGPYEMPRAGFSQQACLPDGTFTFTIYDSAGDGIISPGGYALYVEGYFFARGNDFGASNSTTFTLGINASKITHPSMSPPPLISLPAIGSSSCTSVSILIRADSNAGSRAGDWMVWELIQDSTRQVVLSGGPLYSSQLYSEEACLPWGVYTFNITDSGGDGFGEDCESCGYSIFSGNSPIGGGGSLFYQQTLTFSIPHFGGVIGSDGLDFCSDDFFLLILTDNNPSETRWDLTDKYSNILLSGGPYYSPFSLFSHMACLPPGIFQFTIYDLEGNGISSPGSYALVVNGETYVSGDRGSGNFGDYNSTTVSTLM